MAAAAPALSWLGGVMSAAAPYVAATVAGAAATQALTPSGGSATPGLADLMKNFNAGSETPPAATAPNTPESTPATRAQQAVKAVKPTKGRLSTILSNPATLLGPANELLG